MFYVPVKNSMSTEELNRFWKNLPNPNETHSREELISIHDDLWCRHEHLCDIHDHIYEIGMRANYCGYRKSVKVGRKIILKSRIIAKLATKAYLLWKSKR